jgi:hypothetical protein
VNGPGLVPNPNAAGVVPFGFCAVAPKSNGDAAPPPVDVEGVTGVNTNVGCLELAVPFVVVVDVVDAPGVLETLKEIVCWSVAGAGVDDIAVV